MNLYHRKQRWKIALLGVAVLLIGASIWFSLSIVDKVQEREVDRVHQWADNIKRKSELVNLTNRSFDQLSAALEVIKERDQHAVELWAMVLEEANKPLDDYRFVVRLLSEISTVPMIVTDMDNKVVDSHNMDALDSAITRDIRTKHDNATKQYRDSLFRASKRDSLTSFIPLWQANHEPLIMDLFWGEQQKVFYFDSVFFYTQELEELKYLRDSLLNAFSKELVTNDYLVPVVFINSDSREIISTNMPAFMKQDGPVKASQLNISDSITVNLGAGNQGVIYFEHFPELIQMKYFPFVQFFIIGLFLLIAYLVFSTFRKAEQDQVWVGMAKETAHQLGTPISSLMAWNELLAAHGVEKNITAEIDKDIDRLHTVTNRFSKIGSDAPLEEVELSEVVRKAVNYLQPRISSKIEFTFKSEADGMKALVNPALIEWVVENIVKNAVDAIDGNGKIDVLVHPFETELWIDISDNGKGIPANKLKTVFRPGYTTKKRGWGLGLSLVKRIVEDFHKGKVFVLKSEVDAGTTFRVVLNQA